MSVAVLACTKLEPGAQQTGDQSAENAAIRGGGDAGGLGQDASTGEPGDSGDSDALGQDASTTTPGDSARDAAAEDAGGGAELDASRADSGPSVDSAVPPIDASVTAPDSGSANEVDECELGTDNCEQTCIDQPRSFLCACTAGYEPVVDQPNLCVKSLGVDCSSASECVTGACTDGVCCEAAACGSCSACGADGRCASVVDGDDPDTCAGNSSCNSRGECRFVDGQACSLSAECLSTACVDGFCCESACAGGCSSCGLPGSEGQCTAVFEAPDSDTCPAPGYCDRASDCLARDQVQLDASAGGAIGGPSEQKLAQVIVSQVDGLLTEIRLSANCGTVGTFELRIEGVNARVPDGNVLRRQLVPAPFASPITVRLVPPLPVEAGMAVAMIVEAGTTNCGSHFSSGDGYPAGLFFYDALPNAPGWLLTTGDLVFETFVAR